MQCTAYLGGWAKNPIFILRYLRYLRYLEDQSLRQWVHAQLNKGEALHQLRKFLFFVRDGAVSHKDEEDQNNQAACLNILTNAVIVWNTVSMQAALEALREEGYAVKDEDLVHLSPARFAHIHRYGKYHFDLYSALF
jgi:TnpA family transposase